MIALGERRELDFDLAVEAVAEVVKVTAAGGFEFGARDIVSLWSRIVAAHLSLAAIISRPRENQLLHASGQCTRSWANSLRLPDSHSKICIPELPLKNLPVHANFI